MEVRQHARSGDRSVAEPRLDAVHAVVAAEEETAAQRNRLPGIVEE